jgi:hypothetical protein
MAIATNVPATKRTITDRIVGPALGSGALDLDVTRTNVPLRLGPGRRESGVAPKNSRKEDHMPRSLVPLTLILFAAALFAVPAASAKDGRHSSVRVRGGCTQQSTSKLKLSREDRGIEVEFQVDQDRNGVPWNVTLRRNGSRIASFTATTRGPSGSFEIHRVIARHAHNRISAIATRTSGETCRAGATAPTSASSSSKAGTDDPAGHDAGDDHGHDGGADF